MRRHSQFLVACLAALGTAGCAAEVTEETTSIPAAAVADRPAPIERGSTSRERGVVWDVNRGEAITPNELRTRLGEADLVILGEVADNPIHHARQAWLIAGLNPVGVAFEMVPQASERGIAAFREEGGRSGAIGPAIGWSRLGLPDWPIYRPVFEASVGAVITGGRVGRRAIQTARREGAAAGYGPGAEEAGLTEAVPDERRQEIATALVTTLCTAPSLAETGGLVEARRLVDMRLAEALLRARANGIGARGIARGINPAERPERSTNGPVRAVLIAGNDHARTDVGVPVALAARAPALDVAVLGQLERGEGATDARSFIAGQPYDFVWLSEPAPGDGASCADTVDG
ncbi:MAG: ChaN family lipoprotein [Pseudomonadota bacterium]